jgi:pilus assembly protein Flp/PilA
VHVVEIARYLAHMCRIRNERGASLVEYAFLVALIAIVCLAAVVFFGQSTSGRYSNVASQVGGAGGG